MKIFEAIFAIIGLGLSIRLSFSWLSKNGSDLLWLIQAYCFMLPQFRFYTWRVTRNGWKNQELQKLNGEEGTVTNPDMWVNPNYQNGKAVPLYTAYKSLSKK